MVRLVPGIAGESRGPAFAVRLIALAVVSLGFAAATAVTVWSTTRSDAAAIEEQTRLVAQLLSVEVERIVHDQESVAAWDDAVVRTKLAFDYAWVDENLGVWMHDYFGHDRSYVLDAANAAVYEMADGAGLPEGVALIVPPAVAERAAAIRSGAEPRPAVGVIDGRPSIVSVMKIVPTTATLVQAPGTEFLLASVRFLDASFVANLGANYLLDGARFAWLPATTGAEVAYPLGDPADPVGYLIWTPNLPGTAMLADTAPWIGVTLLVFAAAILFLSWRVVRSYRALAAGREEFRHQALHDAMTGLPNRAALTRLLAQLLPRAAGDPGRALLILDLDRFKNVNDAFGHPAGDQVIRETGARIGRAIRSTDTVFRLGGDEFAILVETTDEASLAELAARLIAAVGQPMTLREGLVSVGATIGIAIATADAPLTPTELMRQADIALYKAKAEGRNGFRLFTEALGQSAVERQSLEEDLRAAIGSGGLGLVFQPVRATRSNAVSGVEVLCRWIHPVRGEIPPAVFIPLAEETGLILPLGEFVLRETCRTVAGWSAPVAINVSAAELRHGDYPARLMAILAAAGIPIDRIELEVTESVIVSEEDESARAIRRLSDAGFRIAIDDFGMGYSSLRYLRSAALHRVKIDRSFLAGIETSESARAVIHGIVELVHAIGLRVTVEGVETPAQRAFLLRCGCDDLQGFLVGRPVDRAEIEALPGVLPGTHLEPAAAG